MPANNSNTATNKHNLIFLIGYMGCGKTTMGKKLAARLDYKFIDLDEVLEQHTGITIAQYFKIHGEDSFRKLESEIMKKTDTTIPAVISTGGGLPSFFNNMQWMKQHGQTVYIKLNPGVLASRLEHSKEERPILYGKHSDELIAFIKEKLAEREVYYNQASLITDGLTLTPERLEQLLNFN